MPFFLLKVFAAAGGRGRRLSKVRREKAEEGEKRVTESQHLLLCELEIKGNKPNGEV